MTAALSPSNRRRAEEVAGLLIRAVLGDSDGGLVLDGDLPACEVARLLAEEAAPLVVAADTEAERRGYEHGRAEMAEKIEALAAEIEDEADAALEKYPSNPINAPVVSDIRAAAHSSYYVAGRFRALAAEAAPAGQDES